MLPKKIRTSRNTENTGLLLDFPGASLRRRAFRKL
jgi:hypothetical protein